MNKNALIAFVLLFVLNEIHGQSNGGWGNCEFATIVAMNAFDPSTNNYDCKKVFVQATNEHYHWDGASWVLDASEAANIYNQDGTLTGIRAVNQNFHLLDFTNSQINISGTTTGVGETALNSSDGALLHLSQNTPWSAAGPWALYVEGYSYLNGFRINGLDNTRSLFKYAGSIGFATGDNSAITFTQNSNNTRFSILPDGELRFHSYGLGTYDNTSYTRILGTTNTGNLIEIDPSTFGGGSNIYTSDGTFTSGRTVTMGGNNLTFDGANDVQITNSGEIILNDNQLVLKPSDTSPTAEAVLSAKGDMNFITDNNNDSTTDDFVWGTNGSNVLDVTLQVLMRLSDEGQLTFNNYGEATPNFATGNEVYMLGVEADGDVVEMNTTKSSKVFYPPAILLSVTTTGTGFTQDLHQEYVNLFSTPAVSSSGAPSAIPTYTSSELYYYITDYDTSVLTNVSISATGVMTFDVVTLPVDNCSFINVVFVVK